MKALSLWQPWASLVALGEKQYETRPWKPYAALKRGDMLAIHAAKRFTRDEAEWCYREPYRSVLLKYGVQFPKSQLPFGAMLCICRFVDIYHTEDILPTLSDQERAFGNYGRKRFAWELEVVHIFDKPIPAVGQQGLFEWAIPATNGDADEGETAVKVAGLLEVETPKYEQLRLF